VNGAGRRFVAGFVLVFSALFPAGARAASSTFTVADQAVVQVWGGNRSEVTVRAWDRATMQLDTDDESVQVTRRPVAFGTLQNPLAVTIPLATIRVRNDDGTFGFSTLPPEDFPYASDFSAGTHDSVRIVAAAGAHVTLMVPSTVAILDARVRGAGLLTIDGYRGGTLFVGSGGGQTMLSNIATSAAFVQVMNGRLAVNDSSFERLRARGNNALFLFQHDRVRQVAATTVAGAIVFDDTTFVPGLARFESRTGAIAIGASSGAEIEARSVAGHVFGLWDKRTPLEMRGDNEATATVNGGGPVVSAVSESGNIFLYDGSLATRREVPPEWRRLALAIRRADLGIDATAPFADAPYRNGTPAPATDPNAPPAFDQFRRLRPGRYL